MVLEELGEDLEVDFDHNNHLNIDYSHHCNHNIHCNYIHHYCNPVNYTMMLKELQIKNAEICFSHSLQAVI